MKEFFEKYTIQKKILDRKAEIYIEELKNYYRSIIKEDLNKKDFITDNILKSSNPY